MKLYHIYRKVNNVLFAFHNLLVYVLREEEKEKKLQLIDGIRIIDLKEGEAEKKRKEQTPMTFIKS